MPIEYLVFTVVKFLVLMISLPLMIFKKDWLFYILGVNIFIAAVLSLVTKYWINAFVGFVLTIGSIMYLDKNVTIPVGTAFIVLYCVWNIYFSEIVMEMKHKHCGILTTCSMNLIPFLIFLMVVYHGSNAYNGICFFVLTRIIILIFYYIHLADSKSCHAIHKK
jgi:hypothetical protein